MKISSANLIQRGYAMLRSLFVKGTMLCAIVMSMISAASAGEITVYTALEDDIIAKYLESFKKQNPDIKVNIVRDSTGVITAKALAEKANPQADVIWGTAATSLLVLDQADMIEPYSPAGVERVIPRFRDTKNKVPHWVGINVWETAFVVNTVELKNRKLKMPRTYTDIIKPEYKGLITMPNPASSGTGFLTVAGLIQSLGEKRAWEYMDKLHENIAFYTHSGSKPAKLAGTGEYLIGISFGYRGIMQKQKGEPVETVFPKEGSGWDLEANALIKKANIKKEAKIFLDWAVSDVVMKEYNKNYAIISIKNSNPLPEGYAKEPLKQLFKNDFDWAAKNRDRILKKWEEHYGSKTEAKK